MKRFAWRLQSVLNVKEKEEEKKRSELFRTTEQLAETRGELLTEKRKLEDIISNIASQGPDKRLRQQELFMSYCAASDEKISNLKQKAAKLESQQREKMAELLRVRKFKKGLERLREEAKRKYIKKQEKLEQKELDEMAVTSFIRENRTVKN